MRPTLVYLNDPLCGWCFGIAGELESVHDALAEEVTWELAMGGLVTGDRVRAVAADADYLRAGLARVQAVSGRVAGAAFHERILGRGTWVSDSEPVCRAIVVAEAQAGTDAAIRFSHALSDALYLDGREPDAPDVFEDVATVAGLDGEALVTAWGTPAARARLATRWTAGRALGLPAYPTLALRAGGRLQPLVSGWASAADIVGRVRAAVAEEVQDIASTV